MVRYPYAVALALLTACSAPAPDTSVQARPMSLEQLAAGTGCTLQPQQGAAELEQGSCDTDQGRYVLVSFASDEAASSWLTEAKPWGGRYLQGPRWVIVGTEPQLQTFQKRVGGTIVAGEDHAAGNPATGNPHGH